MTLAQNWLVTLLTHFSQQQEFSLTLHFLVYVVRHNRSDERICNFEKANPTGRKSASKTREYISNLTQVSGIYQVKLLGMFHEVIS